MERVSISPSPSELHSVIPTPPHRKHDVFLSFRGEDTRKNFVSHLYTSLHQQGISTFKDDQKLERGKRIFEEIVKAIDESSFSIIVFSRNYADSSWCLSELLHIYERMRQGRLIVFPVFYDVSPKEVRKQIGTYKKAFADHEKHLRYNINVVLRWRLAMSAIANLSGWDLLDREESVCIQEIVQEISRKSRNSDNNGYSLKNLARLDKPLGRIIVHAIRGQLTDETKRIISHGVKTFVQKLVGL